jgi:predicted transcriptional regulator
MDRNNAAEGAGRPKPAGPRHSILDLAPLELECLSVLWPLGESTVREIHGALAETRPRAYTTVMTIMDRLAQKGIVTRRKVGRAFRYQASLSAEEARLKAVQKIVEGFFDGSPEALAAHLSAQGTATVREFRSSVVAPLAAPLSTDVDAPATPVAELPARNLDDRLL